MSPIDIQPRNLPRPVDAQPPRDPSLAAEGTEGAAMSSEADSFRSLLQSFAGRAPRSEANAHSTDESGQLESAVEGKSLDAAGSGLANSVFALLQGILPGPESRIAAAIPAGSRQDGEASSQLSLEGMQQPHDDSDLSSLTTAPKLTVAVRHQETHFKPVIEKVEASLQAEDPGKIETLPEAALIDEPAGKRLNLPSSERQGAALDTRVSNPSPHTIQAPKEAEAQREDATLDPTDKQAIGRAGENGEARRALAASTVSHAEAASLPSETLQRLASAVKSDLQATDNVLTQSSHGNEAVRTISIKASESALRILNLQLHPADLGMVTIKMRLAGSSLEMELHVEREETAQLLRHDSEKLSALLRGSGYRPDAISVHVSDAVIQDRVGTRAQADMQMQGQSFSQGGTSQGGYSRDQEKRYADARSEHREHADEDKILGGHSPGGVYL
jgi:flagellar hook-length control protein FliK